MIDVIGGDDEALEHVENRETIKPLLEALDPREKHILTLRFFRGMTQSQIAAEIGISQMHVSRLLARTLERLRESLEAESTLPARTRALGAGVLLGERPQRRRVEDAGQHDHRRRRSAATATKAVPPDRKLHATPSWISWASTTGARVQDCQPVQQPGEDGRARRRTPRRTGTW